MKGIIDLLKLGQNHQGEPLIPREVMTNVKQRTATGVYDPIKLINFVQKDLLKFNVDLSIEQ